MGKIEEIAKTLEIHSNSLISLEKDMFYFRNASNRHEAVIGELKEEIDNNDKKRCNMNFELARVRQRIDHLEYYLCDCPTDKEDDDSPEFKDTIESLRERNNELSIEIIRLKARVIALEEYCADNREDEEGEEEEECEEEMCPNCRETQMKEEFDHQQQGLKAYVRTLNAALKNVSNALDALESS